MNEKAERRRQHAVAVKEKAQRDLFIRDMLTRPDGRKFFWWLLTLGKFGVQPFGKDRSLTDFTCGELNVGQQIFAAIVEADPAGFLRMQQERNDERSIDQPDSGESDSDSGADASTGPFSDAG